jgi:hypothetical protein
MSDQLSNILLISSTIIEDVAGRVRVPAAGARRMQYVRTVRSSQMQ